MFIDNLERACLSKGTKIGTVVKACKISKGNIDNWKIGKYPGGELLLRLSSYLEVSADFLLTGKDYRYESPEAMLSKEALELAQMWDTLDKNAKEIVTATVTRFRDPIEQTPMPQNTEHVKLA